MKVAAAILAAGSSSRLGRPKQLVPHRDSTLVRETAQCALAACDPVAVVLGAHADEVATALDGLAVELIANFAWHEGIASSIRVAASWAQGVGVNALALLVCDQPRLTADHIRALVSAHRASRVTVASLYSGRLGVPAVFGRSQFAALLGLTGDAGARYLISRDASATALDWPDGAIDVDLPEELPAVSRKSRRY